MLPNLRPDAMFSRYLMPLIGTRYSITAKIVSLTRYISRFLLAILYSLMHDYFSYRLLFWKRRDFASRMMLNSALFYIAPLTHLFWLRFFDLPRISPQLAGCEHSLFYRLDFRHILELYLRFFSHYADCCFFKILLLFIARLRIITPRRMKFHRASRLLSFRHQSELHAVRRHAHWLQCAMSTPPEAAIVISCHGTVITAPRYRSQNDTPPASFPQKARLALQIHLAHTMLHALYRFARISGE